MTPDRLDEILDEMEDDIVLWRDMHRVLDERFATGELEDIGAEGVIEYNRRGYEIREWHEADQKPIIMWGLAIWWGDLYNTDDLRRIYVLPHNILQRIELAEDPHGQIGHVFDVDVLFFPFHQRERDHWSVAAIMNPGSIFEATNRLDAQSYPVILSADSSPWATFEYSDFEIVRKWFYEHAKEKHPDRQILTAICFARLRVPIEEHNWDCAYHVLTNMRVIFQCRSAILRSLSWDSRALVMELKGTTHEWLWTHAHRVHRRVMLRKQIKACSAAFFEAHASELPLRKYISIGGCT